MLKIEVNGLDALIKKFNTLAEETQTGIQAALNEFGNRVVGDAKTLVRANSADEGYLLRNINATILNGGVEITANTKYAAYIEFGTRKFASQYVGSLPQDWQAYASTFKGPMSGGGNFKEMVKNIMDWCGRKGIDKKFAYPIARKILINGIKARPYLYPSFNRNYPLLIQDIKDVINL